MKINNRWKKVENSNGVYLPTLPKVNLINKETKVCLMGSCFADEMGWVLRNQKIDIGDVEENKELKHVVYPWGTFFTPMNLSNILDISLKQDYKFLDERSFIRVPQNIIGNHYQSSNQYNLDDNYNLWCLFLKARLKTKDFNLAFSKVSEILDKFRQSIVNAEVIIITLGLTETWIDRDKEMAWHSFHGDVLKKKSISDFGYFKKLNFEDTNFYIKKIIDTVKSIGNKKIIFTVSPIPLYFTFTNQDIVIANKYSKSTLRSAVEQFIDNKNIFYFPSFEIIQDCVGWPSSFKDDKRHVKIEVFKKFIAPTFINSFTNL